MRPRGQVREVLVAEVMKKPATLRELQERCCVGYAAARWAVQNALRCGDLAKVGQRRDSHARRPCVIYGAAPVARKDDALGALLAAWGGSRAPLLS